MLFANQLTIGAFVFLGSGSAPAEDRLSIQYPLTDEAVVAALEAGKDPKGPQLGLRLGAAGFDFAPVADDSNRTGIYMQHRTSRRTSGFGIEVHTPFTWIAQIARDQMAKGREMLPRHVTQRHLAPVLRIVAHSDQPENDLEGVLGNPVEQVTLRSTEKKGYEELAASHTSRIPYLVRAPSGETIDMGPLVASFPLEDVLALSALDKKGELYVAIVAADGENKRFKVKSKHFGKLR